MFGGVGKARWATILVAGGLMLGASVSAQAADLGGDCCSDLEERIAELEATAARKGNRKVSLEISGQVNQAVMWWDDGFESNIYNVTNDNSRTMFRFKGKAKIDKDLSAGYLLEFGVRTANSKRTTQIDDEGCAGNAGADCGLDIRYSSWFIESKTYGTVYVGRTDMASQSITEINLTHTKDISRYSDVEDTGLGMRFRTPGGGLSAAQWYRLIGHGGDQPGEGDRQDAIRYETPTFQGFTASVAFGEDDFWDMALRWKGEFHGVKIAAGLAYGEITELGGSPEIGVTCLANFANNGGNEDYAKCRQFGGSVSAIHEASGLFVNVAAGQLRDDRIEADPDFAGIADNTSTFWAVQTGIEKKWYELGKTTIWGQYYTNESGSNNRLALAAGDAINPFAGTAYINNSELNVWGAGIAQSIDAAAMVLYLSYRHAEADIAVQQSATTNVADSPVEDLDIVMSGAIIKF